MIRRLSARSDSLFVAMLCIVLSHSVLGQVAAQAPAPAAPQAPAEYHPSGYPESYIGVGRTFYPGTELRALPVARAQAVAAREQLWHAESNLTNAVADVHRVFKRSADLKEALAEEKAAWDSLTAARDAALADLKNDDNYQASVQLRQRLASQIEESRDQKQTKPQQLLAMATVKLSYSASATAMEAAAIAADPRVAVARKRLMEAGAKLSTLREELDEAVRRDPIVLAARRAVQDARTASTASDAMYLEATRVADAALDFAYFLQAHPAPYSINSPYYGGYGYGSYGYPVGYPIGYPYWNNTPRR